MLFYGKNNLLTQLSTKIDYFLSYSQFGTFKMNKVFSIVCNPKGKNKVSELEKYAIDLNHTNNKGENVMHKAAMCSSHVLEYLLKKYPSYDLSCCDNNGENVFHHAAGNYHSLKFLLETYPEFDLNTPNMKKENILMKACIYPSDEFKNIVLLLDNCNIRSEDTNSYGANVLEYACIYGNLSLVQKLLSVNLFSQTNLAIYAFLSKNIELLEYLKNIEGIRPLNSFLITRGSNSNRYDPFLYLPFIYLDDHRKSDNTYISVLAYSVYKYDFVLVDYLWDLCPHDNLLCYFDHTNYYDNDIKKQELFLRVLHDDDNWIHTVNKYYLFHDIMINPFDEIVNFFYWHPDVDICNIKTQSYNYDFILSRWMDLGYMINDMFANPKLRLNNSSHKYNSLTRACKYGYYNYEDEDKDRYNDHSEKDRYRVYVKTLLTQPSVEIDKTDRTVIKHTLVTEYLKNPKIKYAWMSELHGNDFIDFPALLMVKTIMFIDDYLKIGQFHEQPTVLSIMDNEQYNSIMKRNNFIRFLNILAKLPIELIMTTCNYTYRYPIRNISSSRFDNACKNLLKRFNYK